MGRIDGLVELIDQQLHAVVIFAGGAGFDAPGGGHHLARLRSDAVEVLLHVAE